MSSTAINPPEAEKAESNRPETGTRAYTPTTPNYLMAVSELALDPSADNYAFSAARANLYLAQAALTLSEQQAVADLIVECTDHYPGSIRVGYQQDAVTVAVFPNATRDGVITRFNAADDLFAGCTTFEQAAERIYGLIGAAFERLFG